MRLILVEDETDLGAAIKQVLSHEAYVVDWFLDGNQAWQHLENSSTEYTLAIFDWMLPGVSGIELCKWLRKYQLTLPVLMLTAKDRMEEKIIGLDSGADDYLVKPFDMAELLARLRALHRRASYTGATFTPQVKPRILEVGYLTLNYNTHELTRQYANGETQVLTLTIKEFQLLEFFMRHPNQIINRDQIINQLWEIGTAPVSNVVAAQIRLLRRKLGEEDSEALIETIYGVGYRLNIQTTEISS
ncbi:response regulator transcription factor [Nostoc spongiaeforme FACHB-130]|uniref:Response regulator transcription factor n=1 Tax=Nostoc spongiaeforme FACHB-130 TaxID=1357510 RepID=A0ABR8FQ80_9NOSO|nr:two-component system response regulator RppA [Nostoc spongiaeforme]MBD2593581.1 response regulator transcription factor [Nostoc spongiaeforme FACHB-130]